MKKINQHYVWRRYLRPWSSNGKTDGKIHCYFLRDAKKANPNLQGVAVKRYFYKLNELSNDDIAFIKKLIIDPTEEHLQQLNMNWIEIFNFIYELRNQLVEKGTTNSEANSIIDEHIINFEEDLHCSIEDGATKYIDSILQHDISFYKSDHDCMEFLRYLCVQYLRTNKIKSRIISSLSKYNKYVDINKIWNVLSHIMATNVAYSFYAERNISRIVLLINNTSNVFITGDQPVINTYSIDKALNAVPLEMELYYPVSPNVAILITKKPEYACDTITLNEEQVDYFNSHIAKGAYEQIYSNSQESIERAINRLGSTRT